MAFQSARPAGGSKRNWWVLVNCRKLTLECREDEPTMPHEPHCVKGLRLVACVLTRKIFKAFQTCRISLQSLKLHELRRRCRAP